MVSFVPYNPVRCAATSASRSEPLLIEVTASRSETLESPDVVSSVVVVTVIVAAEAVPGTASVTATAASAATSQPRLR